MVLEGWNHEFGPKSFHFRLQMMENPNQEFGKIVSVGVILFDHGLDFLSVLGHGLQLNISFWTFESCEMKWKLVCFSSWSGLVKVLLWGTWSDPKLGCWLFKRGVLSQQGCPVQGFKQAEGASSGGGYQNIEIPTCRQGPGHWGSKHTQTKRLLLSQDTVHKTETKAQANMHLIAAADSKNVRCLSHFRLRKWLPK